MSENLLAVAAHSLDTATEILTILPEGTEITAITIYPYRGVTFQLRYRADAESLAQLMRLPFDESRSQTPGHFVWIGEWGGSPVTVCSYEPPSSVSDAPEGDPS